MAGAAALSLGVVQEGLASPASWRRRIEHRFHKLDLFHDLAEDIGSLHWYRGFATMLALGFAALAFWPDFSAVEAAPTGPARAAVRRENRTQTSAPPPVGGASRPR